MTDVTVIGCGFMGRNHAHAIADHPTLKLQSVVDIDETTAQEISEQYDASSAYTDYERAIEDADAVVVATPESLHADQARTVLQYDRHLLLEKPITVDTDEAWNLVERASDRESVSGVSFILRYDPGYAGVHTAVTDGDVGDPVSVSAMRGATRNESERIGGRGHPIQYLNIHDIDAMRWCVGSDLSHVEAVERRGELADLDVPDVMHALLTFEDGTIGTLSGCGVLPENTPGGITAEFRLVGTTGTTTVETPGTVFTLNDGTNIDRPDIRHWPLIEGKMGGAVRRQIDAFTDAIEGRGELRASLADGARAQTVADAIRDAAETGTEQSITHSG
jgi:predicted dehydrogenase